MGHAAQEELLAKVTEAKKQVEEEALYFHYRNPSQHYKVLYVGLLEATEEPCVVYRALYGDQLVWARALSVWLDLVDTPQGKVPRFQKVKNSL